MNYENSINGLIKQLKGISNGLMEDEFPKCANVVKKAATAISTLQAENKRLKSLLGESGQDLWSKENQRADRWCFYRINDEFLCSADNIFKLKGDEYEAG